MRKFLLSLLTLALAIATSRAEPFEIKDGDRVLFLGDTLLEREGTYGYLETRMVEQFPDRKFTVRNLAFSADTPLGWSRASFDPAAKGFERLKEQLALVQPTVVFLGYGMAASLQEMTDRSQDWTLNRDPARYGAEPMSAARFKKELAQCMDAIVESAKGAGGSGQESGKDAPNGGQRASGSAGVPPAGSGVSPEPSNVERTPPRDTPPANARHATPGGPRETRGPAGGTPALPEANTVRFVLLSPIRHEDLRATRPGLPDPTEHNKLLEQYSKAIAELAKERDARFVSLSFFRAGGEIVRLQHVQRDYEFFPVSHLTDNGIHPTLDGYSTLTTVISKQLGWSPWPPQQDGKKFAVETPKSEPLRAAIIRKNALFFHRWRPANETYLFGFRKREQGQNAVEIPKFDPLIEAAEAEIERLKKAPKRADATPAQPARLAGNGKFGENAENSPALQRWVDGQETDKVPAGTTERSLRPSGTLSSEGGSVPSAEALGYSQGNAAPGASHAKIPQNGAISGGNEAAPGERSPASDKHQAVSDEHRAASDEHWAVSDEHQAVSDEHQAVSGEHRAASGEHQAVSGEHRALSGEHRAVSGEHRAVSGEHRAVLDEHMAVRGAHRTVNPQEKADFQPKTPVFTSTGQLYAANDTPATGSQPPVTNHQSPVTAPAPAASPSTLPLPTFTLADGLEISLWAENPLLAKPTECNWDAQGRLWVASSAMYPMIAPGQEATDKIIIIEDPGHTGKATKATVFVDGLLIPTGVAPVLVQGSEGVISKKVISDSESTASQTTEPLITNHSPTNHSPARWGCYVGQSTELLYFEDTDGDGKADKKRIVFSGFGTEDTHHIVHTLRWGPDGRLYFSQSVYIHTHMETPWGVVRVNSGGVFAYDPRTERVEVVEKGLWNTWGHAWDQWGQSFYTDGAGSTGLSWGFPGATFAPSEGARRTMPSISPGSYPKFAGLELIYSPHFPADWQGSAVTCDFRAHKIVHFKINDLGAEDLEKRRLGEGEKKASGAEVSKSPSPQVSPSSAKSGYVTEQLPVLVQTSDATFRPIDVKLGPDGALYIADWSNPIINHGEVDFRDPRRDHEHGRIWRLSMKGGAAVKWESLVGKKPSELFDRLLSGSEWEAEQAKRMLIARDGEIKVSARVTDWRSPERKAADQAYLDFGMDLVMWGAKQHPDRELQLRRDYEFAMIAPTIGQGTTTGDGIRLSTYEPPNMRILAARRLGGVSKSGIRMIEENRSAALARLATDPIPRVRVEAMRALASVNDARSASLILDAAIHAPKDDPQYEFAAWLSINDLAPQVAEWVEKNAADTASAPNGERRASGSAGVPPAGSRVSREPSGVERSPQRDTPSANERKQTSDGPGGTPGPAGGAPALPGNDLAARDAKIVLALQSLPPDTSGPLVSKLLAKGSILLDGSGPWIELIGNTGGPGELRPLLDALLASTVAEGKPLADAKHQFKAPDGNRRAAAALLAAARRGVKPAGEMPPTGFFTHAPTDALPDVLRLAGLWKQNVPAAIFATLDTRASAPVLDAAFDALRTLATPEAADFLTAYFDPAVEQKLNNASLHKVIAKSDNNWRTHALLALALLRPGEAMKHLDAVLAETPEPQRVNVWRTLFAEGPFMQKFMQSIPANFPPATAATALLAARELGRKGQPLVAKLSPLAGEKAATKAAPADYADLGARAKQNGDPVAGEAIYRRMASACTTCHAIGGAGGKLGPDLTSIGASAPADYIIESVLDPAAKVKEGYHAFTFKMKDGSEAIGIPSRETATEQFIRTLAGEQALPKANIVSKKIAEGGASLMPAGLTAAWTDRERLNLYAFLMELGRPGPFDASKNNVARVWQLTEVERDAPRAFAAGGETRDGATRSTETTPAIFAYTLVDGRLTKDLLAEKLAMLAPKNAAVHLTTRFQAASAGKAKLNLTGIRKAWLDGQPLAIASEPSPSVELTAGAHTFTIEVDAKSPPDVLRLESPAASFLGD